MTVTFSKTADRKAGWLLLLALALAAFAAAVVGPRLLLPFVGDDYVFLDKTRAASFFSLWSTTTSIDFGWYRPWSREVYYWTLQNAVGLNPGAYRIVNVCLWLAALCLYASTIARLAGRRIATIATLGSAALAFWGTPLLWIAGSQDLWMLVCLLASLQLFVAGRRSLSLVPFAFALLSKETAAVLPGLLAAYLLTIERKTLRSALTASSGHLAILVAWFLAHPTLKIRLAGGMASATELEQRPGGLPILLKSAAACFNLDRLPRPQEVEPLGVARVVFSAVVLAGAVLLFTKRSSTHRSPSDRKALTSFALAWMFAGWAPLLSPTIGWHAYYGCVGALGAWVLVAVWLDGRRYVATATVATLALLRGAQANTISTDWGDEAYILTAGSTLEAIRQELVRQHPTLPPYSRVYFANIPFRIGLIAGNSPAMRVWYRDSTLQAGFFSYYRPRPSSVPAGDDYFFRFDQAAGMIELKPGDEDVQTAFVRNPRWEEDHAGLAALFIRNGDLPRAAIEFEKLSVLRHRPDAAVLSGACWILHGDTARAESVLGALQVRVKATDAQMHKLIDRALAQVRKERTRERDASAAR